MKSRRKSQIETAAVWGLILALALWLSPGCAWFSSEEGQGASTLSFDRQRPQRSGPSVHEHIPAPQIPPELAAASRRLSSAQTHDSRLYSCELDCQSPADPKLAELFMKSSRLALLAGEPADRDTLEQRLALSLSQGRDILNNQGYYEGTVQGSLQGSEAAGKLKAVVRFQPGPRYSLGPGRIVLTRPLAELKEAPAPPMTLQEAGLAAGQPVTAEAVAEAIDEVERLFKRRGYPEAKIISARHWAEASSRRLETELTVDPGPLARLGDLIIEGETAVDKSYLEARRRWRPGQLWNQDLVEAYISSLRQSGLFQTVEAIAADSDDASGLRPLRLRLSDALPRTVGGLLSYDTDFGPGLKAYWEHRNFLGHGDRLRVDMPLWADLQQLTGTYRYPYFGRPDQDFLAQGGLLHEDSDAYELYSGSIAAGFERRLSRRWRGSTLLWLEGGSLRDPGEPRHTFVMLGLPTNLNYDGSNSLLNPSRGYRLLMQAAPYVGVYHSDFEVLRSRLEAQAFWPLLGPDRLVLALRGVWGSLWGVDDSQLVPSGLRFYSGGGGSVRGYEYQSVGPRDARRDPLGGLSQTELSVEARLRLAESYGLVAFLDGGMVYEDSTEKLFQDMLWGAGLGFRYYSAVGPLRLDLALPLQRREGDSAWQLYISFGQSF